MAARLRRVALTPLACLLLVLGTQALVGDDREAPPPPFSATEILLGAEHWDRPDYLQTWRVGGGSPIRYGIWPEASEVFGCRPHVISARFRDDSPSSLTLLFLDSGTHFGYVPKESAAVTEATHRDRFRSLWGKTAAQVRRGLEVLSGGEGHAIQIGEAALIQQEATLYAIADLTARLHLIDEQLIKVSFFRSPDAARSWRDPRRPADDAAWQSDLRSRVAHEANGDRHIRGLPLFPQGDRAYCGVSALTMVMQHLGLTLETEDYAAAAGIRYGSTRDSHIREVYSAAAEEAGCVIERSSEFDYALVQRAIDAGFPVIVWRHWRQARDYLHTQFARRLSADANVELPAPDEADRALWPGPDDYRHASVINGYNAARGEVILTESWGEGARDRRMRFEEMAATSYYTFLFKPAAAPSLSSSAPAAPPSSGPVERGPLPAPDARPPLTPALNSAEANETTPSRASAEALPAAPRTTPAAEAQKAAPASPAEPATLRSWQDRTGRTLQARLLAFDYLNATLEMDGGRRVTVPKGQLSEADQAYLKEWREADPSAPWVVPDTLAAWPRQVGRGPVPLTRLAADPEAPGEIRYRSPHFVIRSDWELSQGDTAKIANVLEATWSLIYSLPLGLGGRPGHSQINQWMAAPGTKPYDRNALDVRLFGTLEAYGRNGGQTASGGSYATWQRQMLISLPNLGLGPEARDDVPPLHQQLFVIKHEVSHQLMHEWLPYLPQWLNEGFCECIASMPYREGRYQLSGLDAAFIDYLNKWRFNEDPKTIPMIPVGRLLDLHGGDWMAGLQAGGYVLNYNSAALLTWFFLRQDGKGDGAPLAAYFDALRRDPKQFREGVQEHLIRGREPEEIGALIREAWKRRGITILHEPQF